MNTKKFIKIRCQDYMDENPEYDVWVCTLEEAQKKVEELQATWVCGTTDIYGVLNGREAACWIAQQVKNLFDENNPEHADWFANVMKDFVDCYVTK